MVSVITFCISSLIYRNNCQLTNNCSKDSASGIEERTEAATSKADSECSTEVTRIMEETEDMYEETNDPGKNQFNFHVC